MKYDKRQRTEIALDGRRTILVQRWWCHECDWVFTPPGNHGRYAPEVAIEAAHLYFDQEASYRATARALSRRCHTHIPRMAVFRMADTLGANCKTPLEISLALQPRWSGYLLVDTDALSIAGVQWHLLLGVDAGTQDVMHAVLAHREDEAAFRDLLQPFQPLQERRLAYPLHGLTSDMDPALRQVLSADWPTLPHQYCTIHFLRWMELNMKFRLHGIAKKTRETMLDQLRSLLYAPTLARAQEVYQRLLADQVRWKRAGLASVLANLQEHFDNLTLHHPYPGMPQDTNIAEGIIRQLDRKLTDLNGFQTPETAWHSLKMQIMRYRFKRFTDSRYTDHNGKSPLELAGVDTKGIDWVTFSQHS